MKDKTETLLITLAAICSVVMPLAGIVALYYFIGLFIYKVAAGAYRLLELLINNL